MEKKLTAKEKKALKLKLTVTKYELTRAKRNYDLARGRDEGIKSYCEKYKLSSDAYTYAYMNGEIDVLTCLKMRAEHKERMRAAKKLQPIVTDEVPTIPEAQEVKKADSLFTKFIKWIKGI